MTITVDADVRCPRCRGAGEQVFETTTADFCATVLPRAGALLQCRRCGCRGTLADFLCLNVATTSARLTP